MKLRKLLLILAALCFAVGVTVFDVSTAAAQSSQSQVREATITTQPKTVYAKSGATAKTTVKATGDGLTYTWYVKNAGAKSYSKSSVAGATYSVKMDSARKDRAVYCVVKDKYGNSAKTKTVYLRMAATITTQPKNVTAAKGTTAKVTLKASGDGLTYTWYFKNKGASKFVKTSSFTGASYSVSMTAERAGRQVYCIVKDKYGKTAKSNTVTLCMSAAKPVKITQQPTEVWAAPGEIAKTTVKAEGVGLKYQWYCTANGYDLEYENDRVKFYKSSNTTAAYSVKMDTTKDGRMVYCVITDAYGNKVTSNIVDLYMDDCLQHTYETVKMSEAAIINMEHGESYYMGWCTNTAISVKMCTDCLYVDMDTWDYAYTDREAADIMLGYVNDLRESVHGTSEYNLTLSPELTELAKARAEEISTNFSHDGCPPNTGENICHADGSIRNHFDGWSESPGHYYNMIADGYTEFGYAMYCDMDPDHPTVYGVQLFR